MKIRDIFLNDWGELYIFWAIILIAIIIITTVYIPALIINNNVERHTCENIGQSELTSIKNGGLGIRTCYILDDSNKWIPFSKYNISKIQ